MRYNHPTKHTFRIVSNLVEKHEQREEERRTDEVSGAPINRQAETSAEKKAPSRSRFTRGGIDSQ